MTKATLSRNESETPTTAFKIVVGDSPATSTSTALVYELVQTDQEVLPTDFVSVEEFERQFVDSFETEDEGRAALTKGRRWVADQFYAGSGETLRSLRLRKGWSQSDLARLLGTSQSHVARMEHGNVSLYIDTCRKLCGALGVDMNTLDQALLRQEQKNQDSK